MVLINCILCVIVQTPINKVLYLKKYFTNTDFVHHWLFIYIQISQDVTCQRLFSRLYWTFFENIDQNCLNACMAVKIFAEFLS